MHGLHHRFAWQLQYLVAQGFYVILDFQSAQSDEPNLMEPMLLAHNWATLWQQLTQLPDYATLLAGRVMPDLANEPRCAARPVRAGTTRRCMSAPMA